MGRPLHRLGLHILEATDKAGRRSPAIGPRAFDVFTVVAVAATLLVWLLLRW